MNSCGAAFGVDEGGGGNERVGDMFRNVLNATWQLAIVRANDHIGLVTQSSGLVKEQE